MALVFTRLKVFLVVLLCLNQMALAVFTMPAKDKFSGRITGRGRLVKNSDTGMMEVYVRGCGKVVIPKNSENETPKEGENVEFAFEGRCIITDWRK